MKAFAPAVLARQAAGALLAAIPDGLMVVLSAQSLASHRKLTNPTLIVFRHFEPTDLPAGPAMTFVLSLKQYQMLPM